LSTIAELVEKYNAYYRAKPNKWASELRNKFAFDSINSHLGGKPPASLLDIGCGNGHTLEYFHAHWPAVRYCGLDLSDEAIKLAMARVPSASFILGALGEKIGSTSELPELFDVVILLGVMEHLENLRPDLASIQKMIKPDGICYVEVPNCIGYPESEKTEGFRELATGNHQFEWHLFRPTWERILCEAGFAIATALNGPTIQTEFVWLLQRTH